MNQINHLEKVLIPEGKIYSPRDFTQGTVISNIKITGESSTEDVRHVIIDISATEMNYLEGQSIGVIPREMKNRAKDIDLDYIALPLLVKEMTV